MDLSLSLENIYLKQLLNIKKYIFMAKKLLEDFPWVSLPPSIHQLLAHSPEIIEAGECYGLGSTSEEGLEALNKWVRFYRTHLARKTSSLDNFRDVYNHMWRSSSPKIVTLQRTKKKMRRKMQVSTCIEALKESLFVQDEFVDAEALNLP